MKRKLIGWFVPGGKFIVETNSSDTKTVEFVRATAQVDVTADINNSITLLHGTLQNDSARNYQRKSNHRNQKNRNER